MYFIHLPDGRIITGANHPFLRQVMVRLIAEQIISDFLPIEDIANFWND